TPKVRGAPGYSQRRGAPGHPPGYVCVLWKREKSQCWRTEPNRSAARATRLCPCPCGKIPRQQESRRTNSEPGSCEEDSRKGVFSIANFQLPILKRQHQKSTIED